MKRLLHIINGVTFGWLVAALSVTILVFAGGYWLLAHLGPGFLVFTYDTTDRPNFVDTVYFSIVTISSLGYGDIRPVGAARLLVGLEVIVGLAFFGLLVAKISSVKQDYILRRMYADAVDDKLAKYATQLEEGRDLYRVTSALLIDGDIDPNLTTTFRRDTPGSTFFSQFRQLLSDVRDLMVYEDSNGALFGEVADSRIEGVYDSVRGVLRRTTVLWDKDAEAACDLVLCDNGDDIERICECAEEIAELGAHRSKNTDILAICQAILELSAQVRAEVLPRI